MKKARLLIADDDLDICKVLSEIGVAAGLEVASVHMGTEFAEALDHHEPDLVALDMKLPGLDGIELLRLLAGRHSSCSIVIISGMDSKTLSSARKLAEHYGLKIVAVLQKPVDISVIEEVFRKHVLENVQDEKTTGVTARDILNALSSGHLAVHYQPKILVQKGRPPRLKGAEALIRWSHPSRGMIGPDLFIPIAEKTGIIDQITDFVLRDVALNIAEWKESGLELWVSANVSQSVISDIGLADQYERIMHECNATPENIILEITETSVMNDPIESLAALTRVRLKGFALSLDDFGTGYSSLAHLYKMPFSELKVDRMFIQDCAKNPEALEIVQFLIELGDTLGVDICLEGVEDEELISKVIRDRPLLLQGYHFSAAMPADQIPGFAANLHENSKLSKLVS